MQLENAGAKCNLDTWTCQIQEYGTASGKNEIAAAIASNTEEESAVAGVEMMYENPVDNTFFCGMTFAEIRDTCLLSKPCPGGFASSHCSNGEGCFYVPGCKTRYELVVIANGSQIIEYAAAVMTDSPRPPPPATLKPSTRPTNLPTRDSNIIPQKEKPANPPTRSPTSSRPSSKSTMTSSTNEPVSSFAFMSANEQQIKFTNTKLPSSPPPVAMPSKQSEVAKESACKLCGTGVNGIWHVVRENVNVNLSDKEVSCLEVSNQVGTRFEPNSEQCIDTKNRFYYDCCIEKCSLCGNSNLDLEATILFSGEETSCHDLDSRIFIKNGVSFDSPRCAMSQSMYSKTCCVQAEAPEHGGCNICRSIDGISFNLNNNARVSYDGEIRSCLDVHHSLNSRREFSSSDISCIDAQEKMFDQCCEAISSSSSTAAVPRGDSSSIEASATSSSVNDPAADGPNSPGSHLWYTKSLSSPASGTKTSSWAYYCVFIAVGICSTTYIVL